MKIKLLIIGITIILFSCSQKYTTYENAQTFLIADFKDSQNLNGTELNFDSLIMRPSDILVVDSLLITIEPSMEKLFHLFNLKDKKQIGRRINQGQGPKDMIRPKFLGYEDNIIRIMDMPTFTMFEYKDTDFINNPDPDPIRRIKLDNPVFIDTEILNDYIIGYFDDKQYQLNIFDLNGKEVKKIAPYPVPSIPLSDMEKKEVFYMNFTTDGMDKIAVCYYMTDLIEIYGVNGNLHKRLHGPEQFISRFKEYRDGEITGSSPIKGANRDAFFSPENAGDVFFVLYNGGSLDDPDHSSACNQLFSFSWNGVPQKIYNLNDPITNFTVDPDNKKIYGISNTPEYHIVEYTLAEFDIAL